MTVQERDDLPADLKRRHIAVQVDPVQALDIQHRVTVKQLRHRDHMRHDDRLAPASIAVPSLDPAAPLSNVSRDKIAVAVLRPREDVPAVEVISHDGGMVRRLIGKFAGRPALAACYEAGRAAMSCAGCWPRRAWPAMWPRRR